MTIDSAELLQCPTCACLPDLTTSGQLHRAKTWIQGKHTIDMFSIVSLQLILIFTDWKTTLDHIQHESTAVSLILHGNECACSLSTCSHVFRRRQHHR
jgi:hypothetical protein